MCAATRNTDTALRRFLAHLSVSGLGETLLPGFMGGHAGRRRELRIPNDVSPPFYFSPLEPGTLVDRTQQPFTPSTPS